MTSSDDEPITRWHDVPLYREPVRARTLIAPVLGTGRTTMARLEASVGHGMPGLYAVGFSSQDAAEGVREAISAALGGGVEAVWPDDQVTLKVTPACAFPLLPACDLAVAVVFLAALGVVPADSAQEVLLLGSLNSDGRVGTWRGVLADVRAAAAAGCTTVVVPIEDADEACLVEGVRVIAVGSLAETVAWLRDPTTRAPHVPADRRSASLWRYGDDGSPLKLPRWVRLALETAAAGGHHLRISTPMCRSPWPILYALADLLPDLDPETALTVMALRAVRGELDEPYPLMRRPHIEHVFDLPALEGLLGHGDEAIPGMVSLAHRGLLVIHPEALQEPSQVWSALKAPLREGEAILNNDNDDDGGDARLAFPARPQIVILTTTGCGDSPHCICSPADTTVLTPPDLPPSLNDLVHLHLELGHPQDEEPDPAPEPISTVQARVQAARHTTRRRFAAYPTARGLQLNGEAATDDHPVRGNARDYLSLTPQARQVVKSTTVAGAAEATVAGIAWSLADLQQVITPAPEHVVAALALHQPAYARAALPPFGRPQAPEEPDPAF